MKFETKIFTAIFGCSLALSATTGTLVYRRVATSVSSEYQAKYLQISKNIANTLKQLEATTEQIMKGALEGVKLQTGALRNLSTRDLTLLKSKFGVHSIELIRSDGRFTHSTNYPLEKLPNLFTYCKDYEQLFDGRNDFDRTPLMPTQLDDRVYKYALMPTLRPGVVVNVGMEIGFLSKILSDSFAEDENLESISIYTPSGSRLAEIHRKGVSRPSKQNELISRLDGATPFATESEGILQIIQRVSPTMDQCCECASKGLTGSPQNRDYHYVLVTRIDKTPLNSVLAAIRSTYLLIMLGALAISLLLSRVLSRRILMPLLALSISTEEKLESLQSARNAGKSLNSDSDELTLLAGNIDEMIKDIEQAQIDRRKIMEQQADLARAEAVAAIASQVSHDIRSPLAALEVVMRDLGGLSEEYRQIIRSAVTRIKDIANDLALKRNPKNESPLEPGTDSNLEPQLLPAILEDLMTEKRLQFRSKIGINIDLRLDPSSYGLFAAVDPAEFKRVISNLINNAVEAIRDSGLVLVHITCLKERICLSVTDTGAGIPAELLPSLMQRGVTHGKAGGSGLGLYHARTTLEAWGGSLTLSSEAGRGTTVSALLPRAAPPAWFVPELRLEGITSVAIIDDDASIHQIWGARFERHGITPLRFSNPAEFQKWYQREGLREEAHHTLYLVDFEFLGHAKNGLELIETCDLGKRAILVTSRYDEAKIRQTCRRLGIRLIPKGMAGLVPIHSTNGLMQESISQHPAPN